jgi:hypothetical protein
MSNQLEKIGQATRSCQQKKNGRRRTTDDRERNAEGKREGTTGKAIPTARG